MATVIAISLCLFSDQERPFLFFYQQCNVHDVENLKLNGHHVAIAQAPQCADIFEDS